MMLRFLATASLIVVSSACFATRNDVRILQEDIFSLRAQNLRADSARARQIADMTAALMASMNVVKDSVRDVGTRLTSFQGSSRQEFYSLGQQLIQLGELMGQSQAQLRSFKAEVEESNRQAMELKLSSAPAAPGDTSRAATTAAAPVSLAEGPNVLYQIGREQLIQRSWSSARDAFNQLLLQHPNSDLAPKAMLGIGESYDAEGNRAQGDSVFRLVVSKYPSADAAPTALYKLGISLKTQRKLADARSVMQQVVRNYPRSDEATLATEWLAQNPPS